MRSCRTPCRAPASCWAWGPCPRVAEAKIRESMLERALEGRSLGRASYGYRGAEDGTFEVVPHEAEVVRLIFRLYTEEGMGLRRIVQRLNGGGMPTRRGGNWSLVGVRDVLRNPAYTGTYSRFGNAPAQESRSHRAPRRLSQGAGHRHGPAAPGGEGPGPSPSS